MRSVILLHWAPRILCILAILFVSMFSLDSFQAGMSLKDQLLAWLMHMIPSFVLILVLVIAWIWENVGGIIFISLGLAFSPFIFWGNYTHNHSVWMSFLIILMITFPFLLVGVLFMLNYYTKRRVAGLLKKLEKKVENGE